MVTAIIAAAGSGQRMGKGINKVFIPLLGKPVLIRSIQAFDACPQVDNLVVVVAPGEEELAEKTLAEGQMTKKWVVVTGGSERQYSVAKAIKAVPDSAGLIIIHDGARPLVEPKVIGEAVVAAGIHGAAVVAVPVKDTVKTVNSDGFIADTLDRSLLWSMQTPQVFAADLLRRAYAAAEEVGYLSTDDAALVERLGVRVKVIQGSYRNIKITTPEDLVIAEAFLGKGAELMGRFGMGYDVHRLVEGRRLVLGGVEIPFESGLEGHSDADVLLHAIKDALLGAAALGDIGRHFPDSDQRYLGISSVKLLVAVGEMLAAQGWRANNIDAVVVAEKPKLAPYIQAMNENIAAALKISTGQVNVKATTTEGLGFTGRREGIAAYAVVSIGRCD